MVDAMPAWSPDASRLVYIRFFDQNPRNRHFQVVIRVFADSTDKVIADSTKQAIFYADWNPVP